MTDRHRPDTDSQKSALAQKLEALYSEILERVGFGASQLPIMRSRRCVQP